MGPAVIGAAAVQVNVMINSSFASSIPSAVAWLSYAFRFMQFPIGVFGVAINNISRVNAGSQPDARDPRSHV